MTARDSSRLETLEIIVTHLQKSHDELNLVVYNQQREIDRLKQSVAKLHASYSSLLESSRTPRSLQDDRPPHY